MCLAVLEIQFAQGDPTIALCSRNINLGTKDEQGGRKIAGEGGMTALPLRGHMANAPVILETKVICGSPPFALIVVNAAGVEAQIAPYGA